MSKVDDKEFEELLDLFRENNLTKYGIDRLYGAIIDRKIEIERLNNVIEKLEQENAVLKTQVVNKDKYSYGIRMGSDK